MKTTGLKAMVVTWMATVIAITGISGGAFAQTTASTAKPVSSFKQEKYVINKDLTNINKQQLRVKALEKQCKEERAAGVKKSSTHSDLLKAKADLKRDKAYLRADKKGLVLEHQAHIDAHRAEVKEERAQLKELKKQLDADLAAGNYVAVSRTREILNLKQDLKQHETALKNAENRRDTDVALINKEIRDWNGETAELLPPENGKSETVAMK